jgi:hypothetical protein
MIKNIEWGFVAIVVICAVVFPAAFVVLFLGL